MNKFSIFTRKALAQVMYKSLEVFDVYCRYLCKVSELINTVFHEKLKYLLGSCRFDTISK
jgi:hypothetical protein